ncbi:MAG: type II toxin-antitoxin system death-on-curing family toxin [Spirochaetia bacterium]|nr:type II toxin-antitoxin system death-on-curing family toxin [Spirochaetia bacterium]
MVLCFGLIQNHPFIDGDKRIGVHLCDVFLERNGIKLDYADEDLVQLGLSVADGSWKITEILVWIERHQGYHLDPLGISFPMPDKVTLSYPEFFLSSG